MRPVAVAALTLALSSACEPGGGEQGAAAEAVDRVEAQSHAAVPESTPAQLPVPKLPPSARESAARESAARKRSCLAQVPATRDKQLRALLAALCSEWVDLKIPGVALAVLDAGGEPLLVELGVRCFGAQQAVTADTPFRLGSVSKTFSAALAVGLVSEGLLSRESAASRVSGYADQDGLATPRLAALLRHRSGLGEIEPEQLVELDGAWKPALARSPAAGAPGSFHYANSGYVLVGAMLEAASGRSFEELLRARVAAPLGLAQLTSDAQAVAGAACGHLDYDVDRHPIEVAEDLDFMPGDPRWLNPAGGVLATAAELARFGLALGTAALPGTQAMFELGQLTPPRAGHELRPEERYGDGLRAWTLADGTRAYGHSGNNQAFAAELMFVPGARAIALLSNCGAPMPATTAAAVALLAASSGEPSPRR